VTGPMVVFDRTLYFATYLPAIPSNSTCTDVGQGKLWGLDFTAMDSTTIASGGKKKWCPVASVDPVTGVCSATVLLSSESQGPALIPGVSLQTSTSCSTAGAVDTEYGAGGFSQITPVSYSITFGQGQASNSSSSTPQAARTSLKRQLPLNSTKIDSWSIVIE